MSTLKTNTVQHNTIGFNNVVQFVDGAGTENGVLCRAWVNFNGTGTVAIRASFNVTSITDNGTGDYTANFTNALVDANYSCALMGGHKGNTWGLPIYVGASGAGSVNSNTTTSVRIGTITPGDVLGDAVQITLSIFR